MTFDRQTFILFRRTRRTGDVNWNVTDVIYKATGKGQLSDLLSP